MLPLASLKDGERKPRLHSAWLRLDAGERFVFNKLVTGSFRVGVSEGLVTRALARATGLDAKVVAHRLMGDWQPSAEFHRSLTNPADRTDDSSRPYPFCLAHPWEGPIEGLGAPVDWQVEWKWDGIRCQVIQRAGVVFVWSRGEELVTARFPEIEGVATRLPNGTVLDGEILPFKNGQVLPFTQLQKRIGRKTVGKKLLSDIPVVLMAYDLLEGDGRDVRNLPLAKRRGLLEQIAGEFALDDRFQLSPLVVFNSWEELAAQRQQSRARHVEGLMLKRRTSAYAVGRVRGDWWKWKIAPMTIDAVLIQARPGHGKRASLFTDYTFGVWYDGELVPFAKAYSGLTDEEIAASMRSFAPTRSALGQFARC